MTNLLALPEGTQLGDFRIERVLGAGGFGITYLADDTSLARKVTLKEYFPTDFATRGDGNTAVPRDDEESATDYKWGLDRFIEEAKTLARFNHPNIVRLLHYFPANNTAYMVLAFEEGQSLKSWLKTLGRAPRQRELDAIISPLLDALAELHGADFLHRDIAPDNIIMRTDGSPVLIDFGSARGAIASRSRTVSALVKPGYSPYEQYAETGHEQGPWTDIYALAATLYQAVTGKRPPDAPSRVVKDTLVPTRDAALAAYRPRFLAAIDKALSLDIRRRPSSVAAWRGDLLAPEPKKTRWLGAQSAGAAGDPGAAHPSSAEAANGPLPPPPDAPGRKGGLIDYIERLKHQDQRPAADGPDAIGASGAVGGSAGAAPAPSASDLPPLRPRWFRRSTAAAETVAPPREPTRSAAKRVTPRPRPVRSRKGWRSFAVKLGIGAIIAGVAVQIERQMPQPTRVAASPTARPVVTARAEPRPEPRSPVRTDPKAEPKPEVRPEPKIETRGASVPASAARDVPQSTFIAGHRGGTTAVQFTEDGRSIVTTGADGALKLWNAATGSLVRTLDLDGGSATSLSVLGRRALTGHDSGEIALWDLDKGDKLGTYKRNGGAIWAVAFAGDATRFLATSQDWTVTLWDTRTASAPLTEFDGHESPVLSTAFSTNAALIASGGADKAVRLWSASTFQPVRAYKGLRDGVTAVAFSPDGKLVAGGAADGGLRLWSTGSTRLFRALGGHKGKVASVAFSPDGDTLISTGADGAVRLWDFKRTRTARLVPSGASGLSAAAISPDGSKLAVASRDGDVRLAEAPTPRRSRE